MVKKYHIFEHSIKRKHSFGFIPKYSEEFTAKLKPRIFVAIAEKAFKALGWEVVYQDDNKIEAIRTNSYEKRTHKIIATVDILGNVEVKSKSLENNLWDMGNNSKRVKLFIFAFSEILKEYTEDQLIELENELKVKDNWDDYVIPESLPTPPKYRKPLIIIPIAGALIVSFIIGSVIAFLTVEWQYVIGLFEVISGVVLGYSLKICMKVGNFVDLRKIKFVLAGAVVFLFAIEQLYVYKLTLSINNYDHMDFWTFMSLRLKKGMMLKGMNVGSIGFLISWIIQIVLTYIFAYLRFSYAAIKIVMDRVPVEVVDFVMYHFIKGKTELGVRKELSKMGWKTDLEQEMVFNAIEGIQGAKMINRG